MNEIANTERAALVESLAAQARAYSDGMAMNMLQLGRVLTEAKELVDRGEWEEWVLKNSGFKLRQAQVMMQCYQRCGEKPAFADIEKSKLIKMLSLPSGQEEAFVRENDVAAMTAREVEEAVKKAREEARAEIENERRLRMAAERRAEEIQSQAPEIPDAVAEDLRRQKQEIEALKEAGQCAIDESRRLQQENTRMKRELAEQNDLLEETQAECNRAQNELLNAQSMLARGEADHIPADELTPDVLFDAVNTFMGIVCRMPHMRRTFSTMDSDVKNQYDEALSTVEAWARDARKALDTVSGEGSVLL